MTNGEKAEINKMGRALYKIYDASKVASDLNNITNALLEAATMPSTTALRTIVKALAIQVGEAAARVEDIRYFVDEGLAFPEAECDEDIKED